LSFWDSHCQDVKCESIGDFHVTVSDEEDDDHLVVDNEAAAGSTGSTFQSVSSAERAPSAAQIAGSVDSVGVPVIIVQAGTPMGVSKTPYDCRTIM